MNGLVAFGNGYLMVASDGGVFDFSNKPFVGSLADSPAERPDHRDHGVHHEVALQPTDVVHRGSLSRDPPIAVRAWHSEPVTERGRTRRARYRLVVALAVVVGAGYVPALHRARRRRPGRDEAGPVARSRRPVVHRRDRPGRDAPRHELRREVRARSRPAADGFDDDDAALLAANGFNTIRLGVPFEFLMPTPGHIDRAYLASIAETVRILGRHDIYVLLDFHQDGWGPVTHGNGMPAWATLHRRSAQPARAVSRPTTSTNPALQRAFDNFWANRAGTRRRPAADLLRARDGRRRERGSRRAPT